VAWVFNVRSGPQFPTKHFSEFFFSESNVGECEENQLNIKKQLELAIKPFYEKKTVVLLSQRVRTSQAN
jgi:hypothetical protein